MSDQVGNQPLMIRLDMSQVEHFAAAIERHPVAAGNEIRKTLQMALNILEQTVAAYTPVNTGMLRGAWAQQMRGNPLTWMEGELFNPLIYAEPVEYGRKAGRMPPVDAIELWVIRKLGLSADESRQVAWAIAKSIAARGTKASEMLKNGFDHAQPSISRAFDLLPEHLLDILENDK